MRRIPFAITLAGFLLLPLATASAEAAQPAAVEDGRTVSLEYTLTLDDGSKADSNVGGEPLVYEQGGEQILPALERELAGMTVNEVKKVTLSPEDGYGTVNPKLFMEIEKEAIPADAHVVGTQIMGQDDKGRRRMFRVHEVREEQIVLDLNHPLAGQTLHFDVKILSVE